VNATTAGQPASLPRPAVRHARPSPTPRHARPRPSPARRFTAAALAVLLIAFGIAAMPVLSLFVPRGAGW
jgi:hypothetical protein